MSLATTTVAELVAARPARARLFEKLGLDYCCGGKRTLEEACRRRGLDVATIVAVLETYGEPAQPETDWGAVPLADLCEHIVSRHHEYLRTELPRLSTLWLKVVRAHGGEDPSLLLIHTTLDELRAELEPHLEHEEQELFPVLLAGAPADVTAYEAEHALAGSLLERLYDLTGAYDLGRALCNTHRAAIDALSELQRDLHEHIHEENNILFPRALAAAERQAIADRSAT